MQRLGKVVFILGLLLILISGLAIATNHHGFAQKLMITSFWILLAGAVLYIGELKVKHED